MPEDSKNKMVVVYYLGYPGVDNVVVTVIGTEPYGSPMKDGKPDIGGIVQVRQGDLKLFMAKNQYFDKDTNELRTAYTTDPKLAALVKTSGKVGATATTNVGSILGMLTEDQLREQLEILASQREVSIPKAGQANKAKEKS